jgi:hypothetical protein
MHSDTKEPTWLQPLKSSPWSAPRSDPDGDRQAKPREAPLARARRRASVALLLRAKRSRGAGAMPLSFSVGRVRDQRFGSRLDATPNVVIVAPGRDAVPGGKIS